MPNNVIKSFAKRAGKTVPEVEKLWAQAKGIAGKKFNKSDDQFYAYATSILKGMLKLEGVLTYLPTIREG